MTAPPTGDSTLLYFAYGSNLSSRRLRARIPSAGFVSVAQLEGYDLRFHKKSRDGSGKCDAYATDNSADRVLGAIYQIDEEHKPFLDVIEGVGIGYAQRDVTVLDLNHEPYEVFTYCALDTAPNLQPFNWYLHHVVTGAEEIGLPSDYIQRICTIASIVDPDSTRSALEMQIYDE
jgi:gamma-glutamylcyclotransferase (GGCT)/AIG2-like uncharacterized protein YtfP